MPIAVFGNKTFTVSSRKIYTFDDFTLSGSLQTDAQDVKGKKPSTYIKGPGLDAISFKITLDAAMGVNVGKEIGDWKSMCASGIPQPFTIGGYPLTKNKWLVKSVNIGSVSLDGKGRWRKAVLDLSFEEYVRPGTAPKEKSEGTGKGKKKNQPKGLEFYQTRDQAKLKRSNPNVTAAQKKVSYQHSNSQKMIDLFKSPFS